MRLPRPILQAMPDLSLQHRPRLLVVCGKARKRSYTAAALYRRDDRVDVRAAGVSPKADRKLSEADFGWADLALVMEPDQRNKIRELYGHLDLPSIEVLGIPDDYEAMDAELVDLLTGKIEDALERLR